MKQHPQNVRFWVSYRNSFVKLTLRPDEQITTYTGSPTDEGYWYERDTYTYITEDSEIQRSSEYGGRDCDGTLVHYGEDTCEIGNLEFHKTYRSLREPKKYPNDPLTPQWMRKSAHVYDQYAQAMNY